MCTCVSFEFCLISMFRTVFLTFKWSAMAQFHCMSPGVTWYHQETNLIDLSGSFNASLHAEYTLNTPSQKQNKPILHFTSLSDLLFNGSKLQSLRGGMFWPSEKLKELVIERNNLNHIDDRKFPFVIGVEELQLEIHNLTNLVYKKYLGLEYVQNINFSMYKIHVKAVGTLSSLNKTYEGESIRHIPSSSATNISQVLLNLKILILTCNKICQISDDAFDGLEALEKLNLGYNDLTILRTHIFSGMPHLEELYLHSNRIKTLSHSTSSSLLKLEQLDLSENSLHSLAKEMFSSLSNLRVLNLCCIGLIYLTNNIFSGLQSLTHLYLQRNKIHKINNSTFLHLTRLHMLDLSGNQITQIAGKAFINLSNLQELVLSMNGLRSLKQEMFTGLKNLEKLKLRVNNIAHIPHKAFSCLSQLSELDLSYFRLKSLTKEMFTGLMKLKKLQLGMAVGDPKPPTKFSSGAFENLVSLVTLAIVQCDLPLQKEMFGCLKKLTYLYIGHSKIGKSASFAFWCLTGLTELVIRNSALKCLDNSTFYGLKNLTHLFLIFNEISKIENGSFVELASLKHLDLSGNDLEILTPDIWLGLENLHVLKLSSNKVIFIMSPHFYSEFEHLFCTYGTCSCVMKVCFFPINR